MKIFNNDNDLENSAQSQNSTTSKLHLDMGNYEIHFFIFDNVIIYENAAVTMTIMSLMAGDKSRLYYSYYIPKST